ncbi:MAG TPA: TOBE domain-containing protein [Caulobacteraceae bacterium]|nr:TOBE domain-containing protein [Caulobacteraceae bacterium]
MAKLTTATGAETLTASFMLRRGVLARVGAERIALLEAIGEHGSISAAAKAVGLSYKGAWDAVQALNNLFDQPLVLTRAGGRLGGEAALSPRGADAISGFRSVEAALSRLAAALDEGASEGAPLTSLIWSLGMRTSARNALKGVVESVKDGAVNAEVALRIGDGAVITAIITRESVSDLGLAPGVQAIALIKSSFVILARGDEGLRTSARNQLAGEVVRREDGAVNSEISLAIGGGKTITATITRESATALDLKPGEPAKALIKASHIILAVE